MKIKIEQGLATGSYNIYIVDKRGSHRYAVKPMVLEMTEIPEGDWYRTDSIEPALRIDHEFAHEFFHALVSALNEIGFHATDYDKEKIKDVLDATKYHLEDMRKLVFVGKMELLDENGRLKAKVESLEAEWDRRWKEEEK